MSLPPRGLRGRDWVTWAWICRLSSAPHLPLQECLQRFADSLQEVVNYHMVSLASLPPSGRTQPGTELCWLTGRPAWGRGGARFCSSSLVGEHPTFSSQCGLGDREGLSQGRATPDPGGGVVYPGLSSQAGLAALWVWVAPGALALMWIDTQDRHP